MRLWELRVEHTVDELWGKDEESDQVMREQLGEMGTSVKDGWEPVELFTIAPGSSLQG